MDTASVVVVVTAILLAAYVYRMYFPGSSSSSAKQTYNNLENKQVHTGKVIPIPEIIPDRFFREPNQLSPDTVVTGLTKYSARRWHYTLPDGSIVAYYN